MATFAGWLRTERERRGMSQRALAKALVVSQDAVCSWERGYHHPRPRAVIERAAELFGVDAGLIPEMAGNSSIGLGDWLRGQRESLGWTQAELAGALDVAASSVSRWERGQLNPNLIHCVMLARLLAVSPAEIAERAGYDLEKTTMPIAPPAIKKDSWWCETCAFFRSCAQDVADNLPAWCEALIEDDVIVADCMGRLEHLIARYDERSDFSLAESLLQRRDPATIPASAG